MENLLEHIKREVDFCNYGLGVKLPLKPDFDIGIEWVCDKGNSWKTFIKETKRDVFLSVTDMTYSFGGMHYYAEIRVHPPKIINQNGEVYLFGGYGKNKPRYLGGLRINVERQLKKIEKDMSRKILGKVGEWTYRFNTPKEALEQGKKYIEIIFGDRWEIEIDYNYEN